MLNTHFVQCRVCKCSPVRKDTVAEKCWWVKFKQMGCKWAEADGDPASKAALLEQLGGFGGVNINSGLMHSHFLQCVLGSWGLLLLITTEAKVAVSTLAFPVSPVSRSSAPLSCGALFFPSLPVADDLSAKSFLRFPSPSLPYSTSFGLCPS